MPINTNELNSTERGGGEWCSKRHTHTHTQEDSHTVTPHLNNSPHSSWSISCSNKKKSDWSIEARGTKRKAVTEREREQHWWFVMRSPQQHVPASSTTTKKEKNPDAYWWAAAANCLHLGGKQLYRKTQSSAEWDGRRWRRCRLNRWRFHSAPPSNSFPLQPTALCSLYVLFYNSGEEMTTWAEGQEAGLKFVRLEIWSSYTSPSQRLCDFWP